MLAGIFLLLNNNIRPCRHCRQKFAFRVGNININGVINNIVFRNGRAGNKAHRAGKGFFRISVNRKFNSLPYFYTPYVRFVNQSINLIQRDATHQATAQRFCRRTITPRIFSATLISLTGSKDNGLMFDVFHPCCGSQLSGKSVDFLPKTFAVSSILHCCIYGCSGKNRAGVLYFLRYFYFKHNLS